MTNPRSARTMMGVMNADREQLAQGKPLVTAVNEAKQFVTNAIATNPGLGEGFGPIVVVPDGEEEGAEEGEPTDGDRPTLVVVGGTPAAEALAQALDDVCLRTDRVGTDDFRSA